MDKVERYLEGIYENRICDEYDHVMPIVGDEAVGKSTLILELIVLYRRIRGLDHTDHDAILDALVYDREGLKDRLANAERRAIIAVPDAARVLHKKEAMKGEQVEIEKDFFDVRTKEFLILLGFQDWSTIPSFLQERRAKNLFYLPERGLIRGYNRDSLDTRLDKDSWPRADLTDSFPSLEGTDLWERYKELDRREKEKRMAGNSDEEEESEESEWSVQRIVSDISEQGIDNFISINGGNNQPYIDPDLIEYEYDISARKAKKVKKVLARDYNDTTIEVVA